MGIRLLQKFLKQNNVLTHEMHMRCISGKKIAIDIGIYLYRFKQAGVLIENLYLMCSIFRYYNIHPIFVFDGNFEVELLSFSLKLFFFMSFPTMIGVLLRSKYPKYIVPITLNNPIRANAHPPTQNGNCSSSIKAGKCTATNVT